MGFNGVRKHQKIEDPRYLYWADRLGLLVWEEMPSAYRFTWRSVERLTQRVAARHRRDSAIPASSPGCRSTSRGAPRTFRTIPPSATTSESLYHLTKTLDPTRPVIGNDGWESVATDIIGIHDYDADPARIARRYHADEVRPRLFRRERPGGRLLVLDGQPHADHPDRAVGVRRYRLRQRARTWGYSRCAAPRSSRSAMPRCCRPFARSTSRGLLLHAVRGHLSGSERAAVRRPPAEVPARSDRGGDLRRPAVRADAGPACAARSGIETRSPRFTAEVCERPRARERMRYERRGASVASSARRALLLQWREPRGTLLEHAAAWRLHVSGRRRPLRMRRSPISVQQLPDIVSLSHLRWDFVFQRPQHLMTRCARQHRVFFSRSRCIDDGPPRLDVHGASARRPRRRAAFLRRARPSDVGGAAGAAARRLLRDAAHRRLRALVLHADGAGVHAPPHARARWSTTAWTSSRRSPARRRSCASAKRSCSRGPTSSSPAARASTRPSAHSHPNVHAFPSSVDVDALRARAGRSQPEPADQARDPAPAARLLRRDRRADRPRAARRRGGGAAGLAARDGRPGRQDRSGDAAAARRTSTTSGRSPTTSCRRYLAGWDVALLPFARNEATRFISPTKTPEYLAAGKPVVSTSIRDVVRPYGEQGLVRIADDAGRVRRGVEAALAEDATERAAPGRRLPARRPRGTAPGRAWIGTSTTSDGERRRTAADSLPRGCPGVA